MTTMSEHDELATELKATLAARRELGPDMDDALVETFLDKVDQHVKERVSAETAQRRPRPAVRAGFAFPPYLVPVLALLVIVVLLATQVHAFPFFGVIFFFMVFGGGRRWRGPRRGRPLA